MNLEFAFSNAGPRSCASSLPQATAVSRNRPTGTRNCQRHTPGSRTCRPPCSTFRL